MSFVSKIFGRVSPKWRTLGEWLDVYEGIISQRGYSQQTLKNRLTNVRHIRGALGSRPMREIKPLDVAALVRSFLPDRAPTSQRVRDEMVDVFREAAENGWIDANPAVHVRRPPAPVSRKRLSLDQWKEMRRHAQAGTICWLEPMLLLALLTGQRRADLAKMRFSDIWEEHLHVEQQKKAGKKQGARVALPLSLRLDVVGLTLGDVVAICRTYTTEGPTLLRKRNGSAFKRPEMLSYRFEECMNLIGTWPQGERPSLHECRSLSEREYRKQGIDTQRLLGHKNQAMTDKYNDDRGLSANDWKYVETDQATGT